MAPPASRTRTRCASTPPTAPAACARRSSCWRPDPRPTGRTASRSTIRKLVGAHIIGERATELIHIASTGLALGATLETFIDAVYNFPTLSELYKYAAYDAL